MATDMVLTNGRASKGAIFMKMSLIAAGVAATALVIGVAGCGGNKSSSPSSSSSTSSGASSSAATSSPASAQPADYSKLLIKPSDIAVPGDTFTMQEAPQVNPNGKPGVAAVFVNQDNTRRVDDTILVLPTESDASGVLESTKTVSEQAVAGATSQPADVGSAGVTISGTSPDGSQAVTNLLFTTGKAITTIEFSSAASDPVPPEILLDIGQKQDAAIKAGLPG
jgi:hypothetical protein